MGRTDWAEVSGGLSIGSQVVVEPTAGLGVSPAGGSFVLGARTPGAAVGTWALYTTKAGFIPAAKGGSVSALLRAGYGSAPAASPFVFVCATPAPYDPELDPPPPPIASSTCYAMGLLVDAGAARVVLAKSALAAPLPPDVPGSGGVIARGSELGAIGAWRHLQLTAAWNPRRDLGSTISSANGDVVLRVEENDLAVGTLEVPVWKAVPGIPLLTVDDALGATTGTPPLEGGFFGHGAVHASTGAIASFDRTAVLRQS